MSLDLATVGRGYADPIHGAQQTFRCLLDAMSRPGRVQELPIAATQGIEAPPPLSTAMGAVLLSLLDADTVLQLGGSLATPQAAAWLRFHTGTQGEAPGLTPGFAAWRAVELPRTVLDGLPLGSDEVPQDGATLLIEVEALGDAGATELYLRGPGIESTQALRVAGVSEELWTWRRHAMAWLPRGIDIVLCCGTRIAALPRTTRIVEEA